MSHELTLESILGELSELAELSPADLTAASKRCAEICSDVAKFNDLIELDVERRKALNRLSAAVDRAAKKLAQSASNFRMDKRLRADWARLAQRDLLKLKDKALALREFLIANANSLKLKSRAGANIDLEGLIESLRDSDAIGERTFFMLTTYLAQNGMPKSNDPKIMEQLSRISADLFELHEVRRVSQSAR